MHFAAQHADLCLMDAYYLYDSEFNYLPRSMDCSKSGSCCALCCNMRRSKCCRSRCSKIFCRPKL